MQFADPAWEPKVTREFEALAPTIPPPGAASSGGTAGTTSQAGKAEYDDYAQGYRPQNAQTSGRGNPSQDQNPPPFQSQQQQPFQGQQASFTLQSLQNWFKRLPVWAWWVIGVVVLGSFVQSGADQGGAFGVLFSLIFAGALVLIGLLLWTRRVRINFAEIGRAHV